VLALGVYYLGYRHIRASQPTGDEPSYVVDALSMARDGDRDLSNQISLKHPSASQESKVLGYAPYPHATVYTGAGLISSHGAGLGFALVPGVWIGDWRGDPLTWIRLELVLLDALTALLLYALVRRIGSALGIRPWAVCAAWLSAAMCLPLVVYADQVYPEVPALFCTLAAVNVAAARRPRWWLLALGASAASYLPWLHVRFIPVCLGLLGALLIRGYAVVAGQRPTGYLLLRRGELSRYLRAVWSRPGLGVLAAVVIPGVASFAFMAREFDYWYGSPSWTAMVIGGSTPTGVNSGAWYFNVLGGMFCTDYGWLVYAPVFILALAAVGCLWVLAPRWTSYALILVAGYQYALGATGVMTPGFTFPGRYEIVWVPLLAVPLMVVIARIRVTLLAFVPLLVLSLALTYQAWQRDGAGLLNSGNVGLPLAAHLEAAFPDIESGGAAPGTSFEAVQKTQIHTVGRVSRGLAIARVQDGPGFLTAGPGPGVALSPGTYTADFTVGQDGARGRQPFAQLQIWALPGLTMATRDLTAADVPPGRLVHITMPFAVPGGIPVQTRLYVPGTANVKVGNIVVTPTWLAVVTGARYPGAALMGLWCFAILLLGALLVAILLAQRRTLGVRR
jgi:hypothetical protein